MVGNRVLETRKMRSFGRVKGRALKPNQGRLVAEALPRLSFDPANPLAVAAGRPVTLEIGFGGGEHLAVQAKIYPDTFFLGVEPFLNGVASCLSHLDRSEIANVRLYQGDARDVVAALPDGALDMVYILFPDPWPKTRHHKRRLIQPVFLEALARVLKPGGEVRFATDWADYADWTLQRFLQHPDFQWTAECAQDWRAAWEGHMPTRYEMKQLGDCAPVFLRFQRVLDRARSG